MMNKVIILIFLFSGKCFSQWNPHPSDSRLTNTTKSTFDYKENDIYVYDLKKDSGNYTCIITVQKISAEIQFTYSIPELLLNGLITLPKGALTNAIKYDTAFDKKDTASSAKSILWLSQKNMTELYLLKETTMDMGNGNEFFYKRKTAIIKLNFKGKQRVFTVYKIENEKGTIHLSVISDIRNPLIVESDGPLTISLKEIR